MLRAVVVGFILGFALIGVMRLSAAGNSGPQLTSTSGLRSGAAIDRVMVPDCPPKRAKPRRLILI
ncbi:hypothetical protein FJQ54_13115 [Sandaracinobacter neustonicus]|uniref:Uncharacterized protein n=1 Tax=Sandaracinobacter neustonicus TaxID=1715348 RepID=A0A501XFL8_9SPHN|nr:hypothetical protein FJQ54_13115 [Sandaracinobacter neustonicus]